MHDLTEISSSSAITTSNSLPNSSLIQPLLTALGWKDLKPAIVAAEQADQALAQELQQAYDAYNARPNETSQHRLQRVLNQAIGELQTDLAKVKKLQQQAEERLAQPQTNPSGYLASWSNWLKQGAQAFFGSDNASLVERYAGIAQQRSNSIAALSHFREGLAAAQGSEEHTQVPTIAESPTTSALSPTARRLLQAQGSAGASIQFCHPKGVCDLTVLGNGNYQLGLVLQGEAAEDWSSYLISGAGDLNGDGLGDLVIGAPQADVSGRSNVGRTYVVFGSKNSTAWGNGVWNLTMLMDGVRGFALQGESADDLSGRFVSGVGDVNGDRLDDLVVGAPYADPNGRIDAGKSYVVFGSSNSTAWGNGTVDLRTLMDGRRGFALQGEAAGDLSGRSVSGAGDINRDGVGDLMVGAPSADPNGRVDAGKTYIVFGSKNSENWGNGVLDLSVLMDGRRGFALQGEAAENNSGTSLSSAGDVNGDRLDDLVIGAPYADPNGRVDAGKSYVVFGSSNSTAWGNGVLDLSVLMDGRRGFALQGEAVDDASGRSVSNAGDVNGDGIDDLVIGAPSAGPNGRNFAGKSYVVFGSSNSTAWGNGIVDLSILMNGSRGFVLQGETFGDISGISVNSAGDMNGDGLGDLVIGASQADPSGRINAGKSYVVFGSSNNTAWGNGTLDLSRVTDGWHGFTLQGEAAGDSSGGSISSAGDMNGDGLGDLVIGASQADPSGRINAGKSYIIWGKSNASASGQLFLAQGEALQLKSSLLISDPFEQPILGTYLIDYIRQGQFGSLYQYPPGQSILQFTTEQVIQSEVFFLHDGSDAIPSYHLVLAVNSGWSFGLSHQVVFAAAQQLQYRSPTSLSALSDGRRGFVLQGEATGHNSSMLVRNAGDMNGDGFGDLVIAAPYADPDGRIDAGKSYVVFGSNDSTAWGNGIWNLNTLMNGIRGFVLQGEMANDLSGYSVGSAGDMNGDGLDDLVIGAYVASPNNQIAAGKSYVVFGSSNSTAWGNGIVDLAILMNGSRGFVLQGEAVLDFSGYSVGSAGDMNGDGLDDLVIGAPFAASWAGKSYVVFGSNDSTAWGNGIWNLNTLMNGIRGFVLQGEMANDLSGYSVGSAGDMNGDGLDDLVIGAPFASPDDRPLAGKSYVVFGSSNSIAWGNGTLNLSSLMNGRQGFMLQGEVSGDISGWSASSAGDVNGDSLSDLLIEAPFADASDHNDAGKCYVVFGSSESAAWGNGILNLSSLMDGSRGFMLLGEASGDMSGWSASSAGDVNGDSLDDLVIGAPFAAPEDRPLAGKSYVVFGSSNSAAWGNGVVDLSILMNGSRGFVLQGEAAFDSSGYPVSKAGDVNGDGLDDLVIGAAFADSSSANDIAKSYVVFGGNLVVSKQQLPLRSGQTLRLGAQHLAVNYISSLQNNSALAYSVQSINHGRFEYEFQPGFPISIFTQADINQNKVQLVHDGSVEPPVYQLQVDDGFYVRVLPSLVHFNAHPVFINNTLVLNQGQATVITSDQLAISDRESPLKYLTLTVTDQRNGQFSWVNGTGTRISSFSAMNVTAGIVQFVPDGSSQAPEYTIVLSDGVNSYSERGQVNFNRVPALTNNQLLVDQGQAMRLSPTDLSATDPDNPYADLQFVVSNVQYGQFRSLNNPTAPITRFIQQAVRDGNISFVHDGSTQAPRYSVAVDDGRIMTPSQTATITFNHAPQLNLSPMIIDQGQATVLRPQAISATDVETFDEDIIIEAANVTHGYFSYTSNPDFVISAFRQFPLITGAVQFIHDGSGSNASFALRAFDGRTHTPWQMAQSLLNRRPVVQINATDISVEQGKSFRFDLDPTLFIDPDGEPLNYTAQLIGGAPLPKNVEFISPSRFQGKFSTVTSLQIEMQARDLRGLTAVTDFALESHVPDPDGIDWVALYSSVSTIGGVILSIVGYFWLRHKVDSHRRGYDFANALRTTANLEYHDFTHSKGELYKSRIELFLMELNIAHGNFYRNLSSGEKNSFAVCVAHVLHRPFNLLELSDCSDAAYGWFFGFSEGWSQKLKLSEFEAQMAEIARQAIATWRAEPNPLSRWVYHPPQSLVDKAKACCSSVLCSCCQDQQSDRDQSVGKTVLSLISLPFHIPSHFLAERYNNIRSTLNLATAPPSSPDYDIELATLVSNQENEGRFIDLKHHPINSEDNEMTPTMFENKEDSGLGLGPILISETKSNGQNNSSMKNRVGKNDPQLMGLKEQKRLLAYRREMLQQKQAKEPHAKTEKELENLDKGILWINVQLQALEENSAGVSSDVPDTKHSSATTSASRPSQTYLELSIPGDGDCLYSAVALYVGRDQQQLRNQVADKLETKEYKPFLELASGQTAEAYIEGVRRRRGEWAGQVEIRALMNILQRPIIVIRPGQNAQDRMRNPDKSLGEDQYFGRGVPIPVKYNGHNHYDALVMVEEQSYPLKSSQNQNNLFSSPAMPRRSNSERNLLSFSSSSLFIPLSPSTEMQTLDSNSHECIEIETIGEKRGNLNAQGEEVASPQVRQDRMPGRSNSEHNLSSSSSLFRPLQPSAEMQTLGSSSCERNEGEVGEKKGSSLNTQHLTAAGSQTFFKPTSLRFFGESNAAKMVTKDRSAAFEQSIPEQQQSSLESVQQVEQSETHSLLIGSSSSS